MTSDAEASLERVAGLSKTIELSDAERQEAKAQYRDLLFTIIQRYVDNPLMHTEWVGKDGDSHVRRFMHLQLGVQYDDASSIEAVIRIATDEGNLKGILALYAREPSGWYTLREYEQDETVISEYAQPHTLYCSVSYSHPDVDAAEIKAFLEEGIVELSPEWDLTHNLRPVGLEEVAQLNALLEGMTITKQTWYPEAS